MPFPTFAKYFLQLIAIFIVYAFPLFAQQTFSPFLTPDDFRYKIDSESFTFLTKLDFENARKYKELIEAKSRRNYILTQQRYYRGDIQGKAAWKRKGNSKTPTSRRYNGVSNSIKKWNNARIPYILGSDYTARERAVLARAFQEYQGRTCIRFVPKTENDQDFLYIGKIDGCYSDVGRAGGRQELSLDDGCLHLDTVIHELMHSIGFYHEHERWDRDNYLIILWENIDKEAVDQFGRVDLVESNYYGQKYDYRSIMHYDSLAFSRNGRETLVAREPEMTNVMGSATEFSQTDLAKIRGMYQCEDSNTFIEEFTGEDNSLSTESVFQSPFAPKWLPFQFIYSRPFTVTAGTPIKQQPPIMFNFVERDKLPNCPFWIAYCNFLFYKSLLLELCPQTCFNANKNQRSELSYSNLNMRNSFPLFLKKKRRGEN